MSRKKISQYVKKMPKIWHKIPCISLTIISAIFAGILYTGNSVAATDGNLSTTSSTGTMKLSIVVENGVRIHQLQDIYAVVNEDDNIVQANSKLPSVDACVYSTSGAYTMRAENRNGHQNGYATLRSNSGNLPYQLSITDNKGNHYQHAMQQTSGMHLQGATDYNCANGKNLHIAMQLANNAKLVPDQYTDVVNFTVSPE